LLNIERLDAEEFRDRRWSEEVMLAGALGSLFWITKRQCARRKITECDQSMQEAAHEFA